MFKQYNLNKKKIVYTYLIPLIIPFVALALQAVMWDIFIKPFVWFLFYPTVFLASWIGGLRGAIISSIVSAGIAWWCFMPPVFVLLKDAVAPYMSTIIFVLVGSSLGLLQNKLKKAEIRLQLKAKVIESISEAVMITTANGNITSINPAFTKMTGYGEEEVIGKNPKVIKSSQHEKEFYEILWKTIISGAAWSGEIWNRRKNGDIFLANETISPISNDSGDIVSYVAVLTDITSIKEEQENIKHKAYHDPLTGLPNRLLFIDRLIQDIKFAKRNKTIIAIMYIDLDKFKYVNDTYGHIVGDRLLQEATKRIKSSVREIDTVARMGGDEFTAIFGELNSKEEAKLIAAKIIELLKQPFLIGNHELNISGSIGVAFYPTDGDSAENLMVLADKAMYKAKEQGKCQYVMI